MKKKRIVSTLLALLLFAGLPVSALADTWDISNGDIIVMDVEKGILNVELSPGEIAERLNKTGFEPRETFKRGFVRHYIDNVMQADEGCDFPYL